MQTLESSKKILFCPGTREQNTFIVTQKAHNPVINGCRGNIWTASDITSHLESGQ